MHQFFLLPEQAIYRAPRRSLGSKLSALRRTLLAIDLIAERLQDGDVIGFTESLKLA